MKLNQDYVKRLKDLEGIKFGEYFILDKKICYLSDSSKGVLYENITRIDFISLYSYLQIGLFNEGLIDEKWKDDIERVKWFLKNRGDLKLLSPNEYQQWKIHCNSLYMKIKSPYVVEYVDMFYNDLLEKYGGDLIIYNDTDSLYLNIDKVSFQTKEYISELKDFNYDTQFINYFYIENLKRYIEQEESGAINVKGYRDETKKENLLNIIKREIRRRKLDNLGIE
jgi:hypothetical protein